MDALAARDRIVRRLSSLTAAYSFVNNAALAESFKKLWEDDQGMISDLWIEPVFASETSAESLETLQMAGVVHKSLVECAANCKVFPPGRQLYRHQVEAVRLAASSVRQERPGLIVTAGTGAGKTEAFLLPVLNDLFLYPRVTNDRGVRCIILYPMNALVNDQIGRLDRWLGGQKILKYCHYTGETPEDAREAQKMGIDTTVVSARLRTTYRIERLAGPISLAAKRGNDTLNSWFA